MRRVRRGGDAGKGVPILMYHQVARRLDPRFRQYTVTPRSFASQMRWLAAVGYRTISLDHLIASRDNGRTLPPKPIVITFDDGFLEAVTWAVPILQARGFTATFFLVAGLMGEKSRWTRAKRGVEFQLIDWDIARRLRDAGFGCGSHTMSHRPLGQLAQADCRSELVQSKCLIENQLDIEVRHLAYPFGSFSEEVAQLAAEAGYASACTTKRGLSRPGETVHTLRRVWVPYRPAETLPEFLIGVRAGVPPQRWLRDRSGGSLRRLRTFVRGARDG